MTDLQRMKEWIATYPGYNILESFSVDFVDKIANSGGIAPGGLVELNRTEDVIGNVTVQNQYNYGIYARFYKNTCDDAGAIVNADWVDDFQKWVQEQSVRNLAPVFGDDPQSERIQAQNGMLIENDAEGTGLYLIQLSAQFTKHYEVSE